MKIGVVADTHSKALPKKLLDAFKKVDLIIHAGDFCSLEDYKKFTSIKEVKAVYGNMDDAEIRQMLPEEDILLLEGKRVGLYHGQGAAPKVLEFVRKRFKEKKVDVVIFGHSHIPYNERINGVLYFNPGSPNDDLFAPVCSFGILEIKGKDVKGEIIKV